MGDIYFNEFYDIEKKEKLRQYQRKYYQNNKEIIKIKAKIRNFNNHTFCDCGGRYTITNKTRHLQSKKHSIYLRLINNDLF